MPKLTHTQKRLKICIICLKKTKTMQKFQSFEELKQILPFFDENSSAFPQVMCNTCRVVFDKFKKTSSKIEKDKLNARVSSEYNVNIRFDEIIEDDSGCECFFCCMVSNRQFRNKISENQMNEVAMERESENVTDRNFSSESIYTHGSQRAKICLFCLTCSRKMIQLSRYDNVNTFLPIYSATLGFFPKVTCLSCARLLNNYEIERTQEALEALRSKVAHRKYFYLTIKQDVTDDDECCKCFFLHKITGLES